jgi:hypothetical protein
VFAPHRQNICVDGGMVMKALWGTGLSLCRMNTPRFAGNDEIDLPARDILLLKPAAAVAAWRVNRPVT